MLGPAARPDRRRVTAGAAVISVGVFLALLLPPGYTLLRLAGSRGDGLPGLAAAVGLGWAVALPLYLAELRLGARGLLAAVALACLAWLRPGRAALREAARLAPDLVLPLALGALAWGANVGDLRREAGAVSLRLGFEAADRVGYAVLADELERAPAPHRLENPLFAPEPLQYSLFPSLSALLLRRYAGADRLAVSLVGLPVVGLVMVGLAVAGLLAQWGAARPVRLVTTLLVVLGGDLSFLTATRDRTGLERAGHFFAFHSFSAEALLYNPWVLGLPLALAAFLLAGRWLAGGRRAALVLAALTLGALWQTKAFAFLAILGAAVVAATLRRSARLAALAAAALAGAGPWLLLTLASPGGRSGWPLVFDPLHPVRLSLQFNDSLQAGAALAGGGWASLALATVLFLVGGLGLRLLGLPRLLRQARCDASGLQALVGLTVVVCVAASLTLKGQPMAVDGVQFLMFALYLTWLPAGQALAPLLARRPWLAALLLALAVASPTAYLAHKLAPERFTAPTAADRLSLRLGPATVAACDWVRAHVPPDERLVLPLSGDPEDVGAVKPLLVAALTQRRIAAYGVAVHIDARRVEERRGWVEQVFELSDPSEVETALDRLGAQWVWVDSRRPLTVTPPAFEPHLAAPGIWLLRRPRGPEGRGAPQPVAP